MKPRPLVISLALVVVAAAVGGGLFLRARPHPPAAIVPAAPLGPPSALAAEGMRLEDENDFAGAGARYQEALAADDGDRQARLRLGLLLFKQAKWADAVPIMIRAAGENPDNGELLINLGTALLQLDRNDEGVEWLTRATQVVPDSPAAHNNLGVALAKVGRFDDAAVEFRRTLEIKPDHRSAGRSLQMVQQQIPAKLR
ncbi:tetratricopeptide repeat protein [bacterium]|nr:tetratricopeptide repeat protein [bacterium]